MRERASAGRHGGIIGGNSEIGRTTREARGLMASAGTTREALARVVRELEGRILDANWRKETRLPSERELAAEFATSRATVREAIQRLAARGLLETRRGSG